VKEDTEEYIACGYILETTKGSVALDNAGQEYAVGEWPNKERWEALDVVTDPDPRRIPRLGPAERRATRRLRTSPLGQRWGGRGQNERLARKPDVS
jgi:hypothetical protein